MLQVWIDRCVENTKWQDSLDHDDHEVLDANEDGDGGGLGTLEGQCSDCILMWIGW